jgi:signal transduction histidine kinase
VRVGTSIEIDVNDTGIGMDAETIERVFEPFVQADGSTTRAFGGTGLGLALSRRFAMALGGSLTARSQAGVGSTFSLVLPVGRLQNSASPGAD